MPPCLKTPGRAFGNALWTPPGPVRVTAAPDDVSSLSRNVALAFAKAEDESPTVVSVV